MVKILYIVSTLKRTGPTNVLFNLLSKLDRSRFEPMILTLSQEDNRFPTLYEAFKKLNIKIDSLNLGRIEGFIRGKALIKKYITDNGVYNIHINGLRGDLLISKKNYLDSNIISTINSNIYDDYTMLYGKIKGALMAKFHMNSLHGKIAIGCSHFVADELNKKYKSHLKTIYNGIPKDNYNIATLKEKGHLRQELGLSLEGKIFIFVGYLIYRKDPLTTIKGFLSSETASESTLIIIGDGALMRDCKELADEYPDRHIVFLGNQPETLKYLKCADYYIASSYSEGLPTSVMEAMGCGLPVILSNIQPHLELTREIDDWPFIFNCNDSVMLGVKINSILSADYENLRSKCRQIIDKKINSDVMTYKYEKLYSCE